MSVWALIMAAGSGTRMRTAENKALLPVGGVPMLVRSVQAFDKLVDGVLVVTSAQDMPAVRALLPGAALVQGGGTRQQSVLQGLKALPEAADLVLVHDAARPFVDRETILRCIEAARQFGSGVAAVPVKDTIKQTDAQGVVLATPPRAALWAAQTPQAFAVCELTQSIEALEARGETATDDAGAMEAMGWPVRLVPGDYRNIKLTTPEDIWMAEAMTGSAMRVGHGYDVHRLVPNRPLVLCGVDIPHEKGLDGHSDADVATHALMDALLGAAALGDIGMHFPDTDMRSKGVSSIVLLAQVCALLREKRMYICNVDITISAQRPRLARYRNAMRDRLAIAMRVPPDVVSVKATTTEGLGFEGEGLGISAAAVALLRVGFDRAPV